MNILDFTKAIESFTNIKAATREQAIALGPQLTEQEREKVITQFTDINNKIEQNLQKQSEVLAEAQEIIIKIQHEVVPELTKLEEEADRNKELSSLDSILS